MAHSRDIRRCALQALYQFDVGGGGTTEVLEEVRDSLAGSPGTAETHERGFDLALATWQTRESADAAISALTPEWPIYRQPVLDRNILRLAHYEMTAGGTPPKVAINEAVELAREFSTEKSPLFVNGVLDKIYRSLREAAVTTEGLTTEHTEITEKGEGMR